MTVQDVALSVQQAQDDQRPKARNEAMSIQSCSSSANTIDDHAKLRFY